MQLTFRKMSKAYAGVPALRDVSLTLMGGRVHALMGENGAGKSTLIKLIAGVTQADRMEAEIDGQPLALGTPQLASAAGIRVIHQELNIVPQVSVAENLLLGHDMPRRFGLAVHWRILHKRARAALDALGAGHIDPRAMAGSLAAGDKMLVKIASALVEDSGREARLLVLDEPTAALTGAESEMLFAVIARLTAKGAAVLYVSHRMDEVLRICDDVTVLRDGRGVMDCPIAETSKDAIIHAMTGRDVSDTYPPRESEIGPQIVAALDNISTPRLSNISLEIRAGEILGVAGLAESGQSETLQVFMGVEPLLGGRGTLAGDPLPHHPSEAWARGVAYVPRERRAEGLMQSRSIRDNIVLPHLSNYGLLANARAETRDAEEMGRHVRLKRDAIVQPVAELSGGNQQKVVFARAFQGTPQLLLLDEPTRGVDVGSKYDIYTLVRELSAGGCAVLLTSSDLPELLGMCDRILVLQEGRQAHLLDRAGLTQAKLLHHFYPAEAA